jgi:hypothetical protein
MTRAQIEEEMMVAGGQLLVGEDFAHYSIKVNSRMTTTEDLTHLIRPDQSSNNQEADYRRSMSRVRNRGALQDNTLSLMWKWIWRNDRKSYQRERAMRYYRRLRDTFDDERLKEEHQRATHEAFVIKTRKLRTAQVYVMRLERFPGTDPRLIRDAKQDVKFWQKRLNDLTAATKSLESFRKSRFFTPTPMMTFPVFPEDAESPQFITFRSARKLERI